MDESSDRKLKLIKRDQELQKLFELASNRRKQLLRHPHDRRSNFGNVNSKTDTFILKPLRSFENKNNSNKMWKNPMHIHGYLHRDSAYYSNQNLPETDLDDDSIPTYLSNIGNIASGSQGDILQSSDCIVKSPLHHSTFIALSSSTNDLDVSNYYHLTPTTSSSASNTTYSSQYSRTDNSTGKSSNFDPSSSTGSRSVRNADSCIWKQSPGLLDQATVSPLLNQIYRGSPVVIFDNELRAAGAGYLANRSNAIFEKPPIIPHHKIPSRKTLKYMASSETHLFPSSLVDERNYDESTSPANPNCSPKSILHETKMKLLGEYMRKRFSVGDYSTRGLIEWEKNFRGTELLPNSISGELPITNEHRKPSSDSDFAFQIFSKHGRTSLRHQFSSEINIRQCLSTENVKETSVSFCSKKRNSDDRAHSSRFPKRTNFIRRSMNDIVAAVKNLTSSDKDSNPKRFHLPSKSHYVKHGIFKKRNSPSTDLLYSVPPFVRKHLPSDISGGSRISSQEAYKSICLPSSTPNLIAELDPTFQESVPSENPVDELQNFQHHFSKRSRSYRLSFIEDAHSVATKKLTSSNVVPSTSGDNILRFVQPRRRVGTRNNPQPQKHESKRPDLQKYKPGNSHRRSCAQQ